MKTETRTRTYGYIRASTDKQIASPSTQEGIIRAYCARIDRPLDGLYVDPDSSGKLHMIQREAGGQLMEVLRRNDHVVVARMDRLTRSFIGFARILETLDKLHVVLHMNDMGTLDPTNPLSSMLIQMLVVFAEYERRMIGVRTREGLAARKAAGLKFNSWAYLGYRWVPNPAGGEDIKVPNFEEQEMVMRAAELAEAGYSVNKIRQYLAYQWKKKTRFGTRSFQPNTVARMIQAGAEWKKMQEEGHPDARPKDMPSKDPAPPYREFSVVEP
jgi:DNA invertase Pin-like site-specific DNA recombinase